jgi:geranylgeranyl pyrophosphate synthase
VTSEKYRQERGSYAEDVHEGKRSLMVIHTYFYGWKGDRLVDILDMHTDDETLLKEAVEIMINEGSIEYAKEISKNKLSAAWKKLEKILPECDAKDDLYDMSQYLINRTL